MEAQGTAAAGCADGTREGALREGERGEGGQRRLLHGSPPPALPSAAPPSVVTDTPHTNYATSIISLPDSDTLFTGACDGHIHLFRPTSPHCPPCLPPTRLSPQPIPLASLPPGVPVGRIVQKAEVNPNPLYGSSDLPPPLLSHIVGLLVTSSLATLNVCHPTTGRVLHQLQGRNDKVSALTSLPSTLAGPTVTVHGRV